MCRVIFTLMAQMANNVLFECRAAARCRGESDGVKAEGLASR